MKSRFENTLKVLKGNALLVFLLLLISVLLFVYFNPTESGGERVKGNLLEGEIISGAPGGSAEAPTADIDFKEEWERWSEAIKKEGGARAYENLKREFANYHFGTQHSVAHIFGELLYDIEGLSSVTVCDAAFAFGCYHSFFGKALYVEGESAIEKLDQACVEKHGEMGTGCQHGIGHGLLQYTGVNNLSAALELCKKTTQKVPTFGCTSGVFMEYNVPLKVSDSGSYSTSMREPDPLNIYAPCPSLSEDDFKESCYYEMPQWWERVYDRDFEKIGDLCSGVEEEKFRKACYLGAGNVIPPSNDYDVEKSKEACAKMSSRAGELTCLAGASWSFFANPDYRHLSAEACSHLPEEEAKTCAKEADIIGNHLRKNEKSG